MDVVDLQGLTRFWGKVKTLVSDYLPKTGGTITGDFGALTIKRSANDYSAIRFVGSSATTLGYIGCNPSKQPLFTPDGSNIYTIYHSGNLSASTIGAAASSHSHSNYADKNSTSASLTSLNSSVGSIASQMAVDEGNISGLQADVYTLKGYFSSGVANNASKLGGVAASSYLQKSGGTVTSDINRNSGGSWISARDHVVVEQSKVTSSEGSSWNPVIGIKTAAGYWSMGTVGGESLCLSHDTDANYNAGNNTSSVIHFPVDGGTVALTKNIPSSLPASDVYAWAKASTKPTYTASEVGAAASSHSHSNYADKTSTSASLTSLNSAVGSISSQLTADEGNISGLQADVSTLKGYFSSGVAKNASKLGNVAASSYALKTDIPSSLPANGGNSDTVDSEHASSFAHRATWNNLIHSTNEFTYASSAYSGTLWHNYRTASGNLDGSISTYIMGNGSGGYASITASGFVKNGSSSAYVLTGDGGHIAVSTLQTAILLLTNNTSQGGTSCYDANPGLHFYRYNGDDNSIGGGDGFIMQWSWNPGSVGGQIYLDDNPTATIGIRGRNTDGSFTAWNKLYHSGNLSASTIGAAASSHSHSNYADKNSTSASLTSLNSAVGSIVSQLTADEGNISGLQADVSTLKGYFSSGVAKNASKLGNVAASSYALKTDIPSSLPANGGNADTTDGLHVHSGRNNEANKIVRTDGNGYIQSGWINTLSGGFNNLSTVHGVSNVPTALDRIYCSEDTYLRYLSPAMFKRSLGLAERVHYGSTSTPGAYCKIKIKAANSWMLYFRVRVYQSYNYYDIDISGYNYGSNYWHSPRATLVSSSADSIAVTFGYDSAYSLWVAFPTASYIGVDVVDAVNGYTQVDNIGSLFEISFSSSIPSTAQTTVTAYRTLHKGDSAPASDVYAWAKASTKPTYTASEVGAAASSHSHSNYADKTSTSSSLTSLNTAVGNIASQLTSDEGNISGLQADVYNLKSYFSSGVANNASKLGGVAASSYATQTWVTNKGYTTNKGTVTSVSVKVNGTVKGTITTSGTIDLGTIGGGSGGPAVSTGSAAPASSKAGAVGDIYAASINSQYRMWLCLGQVYTNTYLWREIQFIN